MKKKCTECGQTKSIKSFDQVEGFYFRRCKKCRAKNPEPLDGLFDTVENRKLWIKHFGSNDARTNQKHNHEFYVKIPKIK